MWSPTRRGWLVGQKAIDALLSLAGLPVDPASIVPSDFDPIGPKPPGGSRRSKIAASSSDRPAPLRAMSPGTNRQGSARPARNFRLAVSALQSYPNRDLDYDERLAVGMALRSLEDEEAAFGLWDEWSAASGKHGPEATEATWHSLRPADESGGIGLGTLFLRAMEAGWAGPAFFEEVECGGLRRRTRRSGRSGSIFIPVQVSKGSVGVPAEGEGTRDPRASPGRDD